jgi:glycosyltransferase involved in cell wall biosynthesis
VLLNRVARSADAFDIIHFHSDFLHFPLFAPLWGKTLTTTHGRLDLPDLQPLFREFPMMPLVSISDAQRAPVPWASWQGTVHHGLPTDLYLPGRGDGGYLAFIGRISPEKGVEKAINIARLVGIPLKIAAKVDKADLDYYNDKIKRLLKGPGVEFIGEIGDRDKGEFLGRLMALLFPIDWPEPFGLVMIEAMANGTPIIALRRGSVPEASTRGSWALWSTVSIGGLPQFRGPQPLIGAGFVVASKIGSRSSAWRAATSSFTTMCCVAARSTQLS